MSRYDLTVEQLNKMKKKDLKPLVQKMANVATIQKKRLEKAGIKSPAYYGLQKAGGIGKTRGMDLNDLRAEYVKLNKFLDAKTRTIQGVKKFNTQTRERLGNKDLTDADLKQIYEVWDKLKEIDANTVRNMGSNKVLSEITQMVKEGNNTDGDILSQLSNYVTSEYEHQEEINRGFDETESAFFGEF